MISSEIIWQFYDFSKNDVLAVNTKVKPTHCFSYFLTDFPPFLRWCQCKRRKYCFSLQILRFYFSFKIFKKKTLGSYDWICFLWIGHFNTR